MYGRVSDKAVSWWSILTNQLLSFCSAAGKQTLGISETKDAVEQILPMAAEVLTDVFFTLCVSDFLLRKQKAAQKQRHLTTSSGNPDGTSMQIYLNEYANDLPLYLQTGTWYIRIIKAYVSSKTFAVVGK